MGNDYTPIINGEKKGNFFPKFYLHNVGDYPPISDKMTYIRGDTGGEGGLYPHANRGGGDILSYKVINTPLPVIHILSTDKLSPPTYQQVINI
jgi:hypothetical protein